MSVYDKNMARLVIDSMGAMGGSASKEVILQIMSTATDTTVLELSSAVNSVIDFLMAKGVFREENGVYFVADEPDPQILEELMAEPSQDELEFSD
ncbi:uncharacterized protein LOC108025778 [Drosophila biarmipes]|uniref:uncharacterized protein LOC108025778 n=1 Tax=Drosophila biarmipes TaxID=125945 RepID=UPI0007E65D45|nr:uncharacterized protein LOC108025778 [Drosophila biarmipes]